MIWWDDLWFEDLRKRRRAQQKLFDPCIWVSISLSQVWSWSIYAVIERISANLNVLMQSCLCDTSLCQQWTSMQSPNKDYFVILYQFMFVEFLCIAFHGCKMDPKCPNRGIFVARGWRPQWIIWIVGTNTDTLGPYSTGIMFIYPRVCRVSRRIRWGRKMHSWESVHFRTWSGSIAAPPRPFQNEARGKHSFCASTGGWLDRTS